MFPPGTRGYCTVLACQVSSLILTDPSKMLIGEGPPGWAEHPLRTGGSEIKLNGEEEMERNSSGALRAPGAFVARLAPSAPAAHRILNDSSCSSLELLAPHHRHHARLLAPSGAAAAAPLARRWEKAAGGVDSGVYTPSRCLRLRDRRDRRPTGLRSCDRRAGLLKSRLSRSRSSATGHSYQEA